MRRNRTRIMLNSDIIYMKINMFDIETGLSYMLRGEISRMKQIQGEPYDALVNWLNILAKVSYPTSRFSSKFIRIFI